MLFRSLIAIAAIASAALAKQSLEIEDCSCLLTGKCLTSYCDSKHKVKTSIQTKHIKPGKEIKLADSENLTSVAVECKGSSCSPPSITKTKTVVRVTPKFEFPEGHVYETVRTDTDEVKYKQKHKKTKTVAIVTREEPANVQITVNRSQSTPTVSKSVQVVGTKAQNGVSRIVEKLRFRRKGQCCEEIDGELVCMPCGKRFVTRPSTVKIVASELPAVQESVTRMTLARTGKTKTKLLSEKECCNTINGKLVCVVCDNSVQQLPQVKEEIKYVDVEVPVKVKLSHHEKHTMKRIGERIAKGKDPKHGVIVKSITDEANVLPQDDEEQTEVEQMSDDDSITE
jgi:hypothetical protein